VGSGYTCTGLVSNDGARCKRGRRAGISHRSVRDARRMQRKHGISISLECRRGQFRASQRERRMNLDRTTVRFLRIARCARAVLALCAVGAARGSKRFVDFARRDTRRVVHPRRAKRSLLAAFIARSPIRARVRARGTLNGRLRSCVNSFFRPASSSPRQR